AQAGRNIVVNAGAPITTRGGKIELSANDPSAPTQLNGSITVNAPLRTDGGGLSGGDVFLHVTGGNGQLLFNSGAGNVTTLGGRLTLSVEPRSVVLGSVDAFTNTELTLDTTGNGAFSAGAPISITGGLVTTQFGRQRITLAAGGNDITFTG